MCAYTRIFLLWKSEIMAVAMLLLELQASNDEKFSETSVEADLFVGSLPSLRSIVEWWNLSI